ncbi:unnamed protein product [Cyprideis torosa]|uniref:Uncharacterized protein n=1 Tax=Cyprideis torosa TaxID=163714 RepID=A0A7R8W532_9CRUS|nr:unnamed protein product [Cyprideis torosa]CAG0884711.1 unnamed protein product [Cyprideis torosa]
MAEEEDVPDSWEEVEDTHIIDKKIEKMRQKTNSELSSSSLRPDADIFLPGKICQMPYGNGFRPPFRPPYGQTPPVRILKRDDDSSLVPVRSEDSSKPKTKIKSLKEDFVEYFMAGTAKTKSVLRAAEKHSISVRYCWKIIEANGILVPSPKKMGRPKRQTTRSSGHSNKLHRKLHFKEMRRTVHNLWTCEKTKREISRITEVPRSSVQRILKGTPSTPRRRGQKKLALRKADSFHIDFVRRTLQNFHKEGKKPTLEKIRNRVIQDDPQFPYRSTASFHRLLLRNGMKFRRLKRRNLLVLNDNLIQRRNQYLRKVQELRNQNYLLIYLDETWYDSHDLGNYSWCEESQIVPRPTDEVFGLNYLRGQSSEGLIDPDTNDDDLENVEDADEAAQFIPGLDLGSAYLGAELMIGGDSPSMGPSVEEEDEVHRRALTFESKVRTTSTTGRFQRKKRSSHGLLTSQLGYWIGAQRSQEASQFHWVAPEDTKAPPAAATSSSSTAFLNGAFQASFSSLAASGTSLAFASSDTFRCPDCGRECMGQAASASLGQHMRYDCGPRTNACSYCHRHFKRRFHLERHMSKVHAATLHELSYSRLLRKQRTYACFVDFSKALDSGSRPLLFQRLQLLGFPYQQCLLLHNPFRSLQIREEVQDLVKNVMKLVLDFHDGQMERTSAEVKGLEEMMETRLPEARGDETFVSDIPSLSYYLHNTPMDWAYKTEPMDTACLGLIQNRSNWPRGKVLGGSSTINTMLYVRGNQLDYDLYEQAGNYGWNWDTALYYFKKSEGNRNQYLAANTRYHNDKGPLTVQEAMWRSPLSPALVEGMVQYGIPNRDFNAGIQKGVMINQLTQRHGARCSTNKAFLKPARRRPNLHIVKRAFVTRVLFKGNNRAYGVKYEKYGHFYITTARKEVILSAGAIGSPQILMLSGIGPREHLEELGIPVRQDLKVGYNLQDHMYVIGAPIFLVNQPVTVITSRLETIKAVLKYALFGKGPLTTSIGLEVIAFVNTKYANESIDFPDVEYEFLASSIVSDGGQRVAQNTGYNERVWHEYFKPIAFRDAWSSVTALLRPRSKGVIKLRSRNPYDYPRIWANYLTDPFDTATMVEAMKILIAFSKTPAMQAYGSKLYSTPIPGCEHLDLWSDPYLECLVRHMSTTNYHPSCTAKMGPWWDPEAVVDPELRVYGTRNLRVIDASIFPNIPSANLNAPTIMVGERGADLIKIAWGLSVDSYEHDNKV